MLRTAARDTSFPANAEGFVAGLVSERIALSAFCQLLQAEQGALVKAQADRVAELAVDKATQIEALSRLADQRNRHLTAQGLSGNAEGIKVWLSRNPELALAAEKAWSELMGVAETARQLNQDNGLLIESKLQQNWQKLAVLQSSGASSDGVYHSDGRLSPLRSARSFSQA
jgi:flagellar biosynthesis/type III secretory pathway chaperone